jgi:hypothetical protein
MRLAFRRALVAAALWTAATMASAQFVPLARCQTAYPCAIPFAVVYRPDALLAGQYGRTGSTAISLRVPVFPASPPQLDDPRAASRTKDAVDAAVRSLPLKQRPKTTPSAETQPAPERPPD